MKKFSHNAISLAILAATAAPFSLMAQAADQVAIDESELEVIEIRGIRKSLEASQSIKMHSSSVVEAISAEDIGKLPDVSIAESLARLPGVSAQRLNGRAQNISIRGLSGDFSTTLFNGREVVSTGDNRGVEFDQFPSELLNGVLVYKTPDATLMGQGLAGTVDLQTLKPLAHGEQTFVLGGRYEMSQDSANNPLGDDTGERLNATYIDQFLDDTLGVAIGFSHTKTPNQIERFEAWGPKSNDEGTMTELGGAKISNTSNLLERDSVMAIIEWNPTDKLHTTLDLFYSEFKETQNTAMLEMGMGWSDAVLQPGYVIGDNGNIIEGTYDNVKTVVRNDANTRDSDLFAAGWNTKYNLTDDWTVTLDVAHSDVQRVDMNLETYGGTESATDTIHYRKNGGVPVFDHVIDYSDTSIIGLTDSANWGQVGFSKFSHIDDEINQIRLSADRFLDGDVFTNVSFGTHYVERTKEKSAEEFIINGFANGSDIYYGYPTHGNADFSNFGMGDVVVWDPVAMYNSGIYDIEEFHTQTLLKKNGWLKKTY